MKHSARWLLPLLGLTSTLAIAQWQWQDKDGRMVFSDRAPPTNIPDKAIVKRPGAAQLAPVVRADEAAGSGVAALPVAASSAAKTAGTDKDLLEKKKKADAEAAAKLKAEEQRVLAAKAENCQRAKASKAGLESGMRLSRVNAQGEREILDDAARAAELKRAQAVIDSDCK